MIKIRDQVLIFRREDLREGYRDKDTEDITSYMFRTNVRNIHRAAIILYIDEYLNVYLLKNRDGAQEGFYIHQPARVEIE